MIYSAQDLLDISDAYAEGGDVWNNNKVEGIKIRLKQFYRNTSDEQCCYCKKDFGDEFNMVIDIEHILPKKKYTDYMFEIFNLNIACKRCNMRIKKDNIDFIVDVDTIIENRLDKDQYKFIHPNFDIYFEHLEVLQVIRNNKKFIKYFIVNESEKGNYTYKYFELEKRETDTINEAQGIQIKESTATDLIPKQIVIDLEDLLKKI